MLYLCISSVRENVWSETGQRPSDTPGKFAPFEKQNLRFNTGPTTWIKNPPCNVTTYRSLLLQNSFRTSISRPRQRMVGLRLHFVSALGIISVIKSAATRMEIRSTDELAKSIEKEAAQNWRNCFRRHQDCCYTSISCSPLPNENETQRPIPGTKTKS